MKSLGLVRSSTKYLFIVVFTVGPYSAFTLRAEAAPLSGAFGTNFYEFVEVSDPFTGDNNSWATANSAASAKVYTEVSGHLTTISSQGENDFLFGLVSGDFSGFRGGWLGGKWDEGWLVGPESGQTFSYTNWPDGGLDPNNNGYVYMSIGTTTAPGNWLDDSDVGGGVGVPHYLNDPVIGYFVEYEEAVPEPSTLALLSMGTLALLAYAWRRRRCR